MKFRKFFIFASSISIAPVVLFINACYGQLNNVYQPGQIYSKEFFDQTPIVLDMTAIQKQESLLTLPNMNSFLNNKLVIGRYNEQRKFYGALTDDSYHYGLDLLVEQGTSVVAPYDGEILYITYVHDASGPTPNEGIGGVVVMKVLVESMTNLSQDDKKNLLDLLNDKKIEAYSTNAKVQNIETDYVYIQFMHLSQSLLGMGKTFTNPNPQASVQIDIIENIDYKNPLKVKQGDKIGFVGIPEENGGWAPHVHVQMINPAIEKNTSISSIVRFSSTNTKSIATRRVVGVGPRKYIDSGAILDPNIWLKLVKNNSFIYKVKDKE